MTRHALGHTFNVTLLTVFAGASLTMPAGAQPVGVPDPAIAVARTIDIQCAPRAAWTMPEAPLSVVGSREGEAKRMFGPGDTIIIAADVDAHLAAGDEFFVRRQFRPRVETVVPYGEMPAVLHTSGWVRIVAVDGVMAVAVIVHACDGVLRGDYLEPFSVPPPPVGAPRGEADYTEPATILFTEEGGYTAGIHNFAVIDRGRDADVVLGQRFTLFRETIAPQGPVSNLGEAFVVEVGERTSTVRIFGTRDAVYGGDRLATHR